MTAAEKITALRATHEAATPAPWVADVAAMSSTGPDAVYGDYQHPGIEGRPFICETFFNEAADAAAIVSAHNALPALLKALEDVLELHYEVPVHHGDGKVVQECLSCSDPYPCDTAYFIEAALAEVDHG